jgi:hypothetical protein
MHRVLVAFLLSITLMSVGVSAQTIYAGAHGGPAALFSTFYTLNPATGAPTHGFDFWKGFGALAFAPNGTLYGTAMAVPGGLILLTIDPVNQSSNPIGFIPGLGSPVNDLAFRPSDGTLFAYVNTLLYTIDPGTGLPTFVGGPAKLGFGGLAFRGDTLYAASTPYLGGTTWLQTLDQVTGLPTNVVPLTYDASVAGNMTRVTGMKFNPVSGVLYAAIATGDEPDSILEEPKMGYLGRIDIVTGAVTVIGPVAPGLDAIAVAESPNTSALAIPALSASSLIGLSAMLAMFAALSAGTRRGD